MRVVQFYLKKSLKNDDKMMNKTAVTMTVTIVVMTAAATVTAIINIMVATIVVTMAVTWAGTKTGNVKHRIKYFQIKEHLRVLFVYLTTTLKKDTVSFLRCSCLLLFALNACVAGAVQRC